MARLLARLRVLVKRAGLTTLSAPPNLISNPLSPLTFHRFSSQLSRLASSRQLPARQLLTHQLILNLARSTLPTRSGVSTGRDIFQTYLARYLRDRGDTATLYLVS